MSGEDRRNITAVRHFLCELTEVRRGAFNRVLVRSAVVGEDDDGVGVLDLICLIDDALDRFGGIGEFEAFDPLRGDQERGLLSDDANEGDLCAVVGSQTSYSSRADSSVSLSSTLPGRAPLASSRFRRWNAGDARGTSILVDSWFPTDETSMPIALRRRLSGCHCRHRREGRAPNRSPAPTRGVFIRRAYVLHSSGEACRNSVIESDDVAVVIRDIPRPSSTRP